MLFRYRARNFLDTLSGDERQRWNSYRQERWLGSEGVEEQIEILMENSDDSCLVDLRTYVDEVRDGVYE
jgi:exodeoxyribonuclease-1